MLCSTRTPTGLRNGVRYYPIFLDLRFRKTVVVGAGRVAERKVKSLLQAGARVTVVAPQASPTLRKLAAADKIRWKRRAYGASDLKGAALVFSATDSAEVERKVATDASRRGIPANCAGSPQFGSFLVPAQVLRGHLQIAIGTAGASPALAHKLRRELEERFGPEYAEWTRLLTEVRPRILKSVPAAERPRVFERLVSDGILGLLRKGENRRAAELARRMVERFARKQRPRAPRRSSTPVRQRMAGKP